MPISFFSLYFYFFPKHPPPYIKDYDKHCVVTTFIPRGVHYQYAPLFFFFIEIKTFYLDFLFHDVSRPFPNVSHWLRETIDKNFLSCVTRHSLRAFSRPLGIFYKIVKQKCFTQHPPPAWNIFVSQNKNVLSCPARDTPGTVVRVKHFFISRSLWNKCETFLS